MFVYTIKRLIAGVITVWFIATATFVAMHSVPGDPLMNDKAVTKEIRANLEARYGLDRPLPEQYFMFLGNMLQGDFGISFTQQNRRVNDIVRDHFGKTLYSKYRTRLHADTQTEGQVVLHENTVVASIRNFVAV